MQFLSYPTVVDDGGLNAHHHRLACYSIKPEVGQMINILHPDVKDVLLTCVDEAAKQIAQFIGRTD